MLRRPYLSAILSLIGLSLTATAARASTYYYVNWSSDALSSNSNGVVSGSVITPQGNLNVTYTGDVAQWTQINFIGNDYYSAWPLVYRNSTVSNLPTNVDLITMAQAQSYINTLFFSSPVVNPILDLVSVGAPWARVSYNFSATPVILSQGSGAFGGCDTCLALNGNTVTGVEGNGVLEFVGTYSQLSWTTTGGEAWNGFTVGVAGIAVDDPAPLPDAATTPEPATWTGLLAGSFLMACRYRRRTGASR